MGVAGEASPFGLHGQGGIGKTVLAAELTRDPGTLDHFPDGVFWLSLGQRPDVLGAQRQLAGWLGGDPEFIRSEFQGTKVLSGLATGKQCLVVLDDVWSVEVARALTVTGPSGRLLLTTRDRSLLEELGAATISLDVLRPAAARELLGQLTGLSARDLPAQAEQVLDATGRVALAVALVGAAIGRRPGGWVTVTARLVEDGDVFAGHPYADIFKALEVSTAGLGEDELLRYQALACFPEDTFIPDATIGRLWGLNDTKLRAQLERFAELKLVRLEKEGVAFHDVERDYLLLHALATAAAHERLLASHRPDGPWHLLDPDDPYLHDHLAYHLAAAGRHHELVSTAIDPRWLAVRISLGGTVAAERDLSEALHWEPGEERLEAHLRRIRQTAHLLDRAAALNAIPAALAIQLWALGHEIDFAPEGTAAANMPAVAWVADPTSPNLLRIIAGHDTWVSAVAWSPDGSRLASGAGDCTVRVWDAAGGAPLAELAGHDGPVSSVAWSPDSALLASGAGDRTVRIWDVGTGAERLVFTGHNGAVSSAAWSPDGSRLASGADDGRILVWDVASGAGAGDHRG